MAYVIARLQRTIPSVSRIQAYRQHEQTMWRNNLINTSKTIIIYQEQKRVITDFSISRLFSGQMQKISDGPHFVS